MKHQPRYFIYLILGAIALLCPLANVHASGDATGEEALLDSMQARLPELMQLKLAGAVGETNMGLLEARTVLEREQRSLVSDENRDRLAHYKLIADRLGLPVSAVQRKRAEQIRENSPRGIWIESTGGVWFRE